MFPIREMIAPVVSSPCSAKWRAETRNVTQQASPPDPPDKQAPPGLDLVPFSPSQPELNQSDRDELRRIVSLLHSQRQSLIRPAAWVGKRVHAAGRIVADLNGILRGPRASGRTAMVEAALRAAYAAGTFRLDPSGTTRPSRHRFGRMLAAASGTTSGLVGAAGIAADLPLITMMMMRSIAAIARAHGEDISTEETRRACLEVFALGSPEDGEQDIDTAFWATRAAFTHASLTLLIRQATQRFGLAITQRYLAQAVPLLGAVTGGTLNYLFMQHYQRMAEVHFTLRELERRHDPQAVRACFNELMAEARRPAE